MTAAATAPADLQRRYGLLAGLLSDGRCSDARLVTGEHRAFRLNAARGIVQVPHPLLDEGWGGRTATCGIALQCAPTKQALAGVSADVLSPREQRALALVEGRAATAWVAQRWPGLVPELTRVLGAVADAETETETEPDVDAMVVEAIRLARTGDPVTPHPLYGRLPLVSAHRSALAEALRRQYGRMPWTSRQRNRRRIHSTPVGGDGGVQDPNLPPPSRPEDLEDDVRADARVGIPYPEWNLWTRRLVADHVAVVERPFGQDATHRTPVSPSVRRWFEAHTHRTVRSGLADGAEIDTARYVDHVVALAAGSSSDGRFFRDLVPSARDVTAALLLDGSASLGAHQGAVFELELACADALSQAMTLAGERHGVFAFTGNTRHRVEVRCLKDFDQRRFVAPSKLGLTTGGYTRLGAPIRHLTSRLLRQPSERRLLILVGDGLMSDEGYEGRYAWADVAHAVDEAETAGIAVYYIGVGSARVDPLPAVFGDRRSQRIRRLEELPRVLAEVHQGLVAA